MAVAALAVTGEPTWDLLGPTDYGIEVYTAGDCWALAWQVAKQTGGRLVTLDWPEWIHVAVDVGDDLYLDAVGLHSRAGLERAWDAEVVPLPDSATATLRAYTEALGAGFVYLSGHGEAADFAHRLVGHHLRAGDGTGTTIGTATGTGCGTGDGSVTASPVGLRSVGRLHSVP